LPPAPRCATAGNANSATTPTVAHCRLQLIGFMLLAPLLNTGGVCATLCPINELRLETLESHLKNEKESASLHYCNYGLGRLQMWIVHRAFYIEAQRIGARRSQQRLPIR
jgi:hypothetical protein